MNNILNPQDGMMNSNWDVPRNMFSPFHPPSVKPYSGLPVIGQVFQKGRDTILWDGPILSRQLSFGYAKAFSSPVIHLAGQRWSFEIGPSFYPPMWCLLLRRLEGPARKTCEVVVEGGADWKEQVFSCVHFGGECIISEHLSLAHIFTITLRLTEGEAALQVPPVPFSIPSIPVIGRVSQIGQDTIVWDGPGLSRLTSYGFSKAFCSPDFHLPVGGMRWGLKIEPSSSDQAFGQCRMVLGCLGPGRPAKPLLCTLVVKSAGGKEEVYSCCIHPFGIDKNVISNCISCEILTVTLRVAELGAVPQVPPVPWSSTRHDCDNVIGQVSRWGQDTIVWDGPTRFRPIKAGKSFCSPGPSCTTFMSCDKETEVFDIKSGQVIEDKGDNCRCSDAKGVMLLVKHMNDLLEKGDDFDVRFHVQDRELAAHRNILKARCPVFYTMLTHDTQEKKSGVIRIEDCDADAFEIFLVYLYTGRAKGLTSKKARDLYSIANKYDFSELKEECVAFLKRNLSKATICDAILLSLKHDDSELWEAAKNFFVQNVREILASAEWDDFIEKYPAEEKEFYIELLNPDGHSTDGSSRTSYACESVPSCSSITHGLQTETMAEQDREQHELITPPSSPVLGRSRRPNGKSCTTDVPESMPMNAASNDFTEIFYSFGRHSVPYLDKLPGKNITLKQFKSFLSQKDLYHPHHQGYFHAKNFKYLFKTASNDFVEVNNDSKVLPLWEGKVFCVIGSTVPPNSPDCTDS